MPVFIAALWGALAQMIGSLVGRILVSLGMGVVTYKGVDTTLTWLKGQAIASASGLPPEIFGLLNFLKVGECISIITSAIVVRLTMQGMVNGSVKSWKIK